MSYAHLSKKELVLALSMARFSMRRQKHSPPRLSPIC
jgi:hypothetical protein